MTTVDARASFCISNAKASNESKKQGGNEEDHGVIENAMHQLFIVSYGH